MDRATIDKKYKWDLEDIFPNIDAWNEDFSKLEKMTDDLASMKGSVAALSGNEPGDADVVAAIIHLSETAELLAERLYLYAHMKKDENFNDMTYVALTDKIMGMFAKYSASTSYIRPEILELDQDILIGWCKTCPALAGYERFFNEMFRGKPHVLSPVEEKLLAQASEMSEVADNVFSMFANGDLKLGTIKDENGNEIKLTNANYISYMESADRRVRREAFEHMYGAYGSFRNTIATAYTGHIKGSTFYKEARKYRSCLEMFLFNDNVKQEVYDNLIKTVDEHLDIFDEYLKLRKKRLSVDELHMYDLYTPITSKEAAQHEYSYEEAVKIVKEGTAVLGADYVQILEEGFNGGWVDVYETEGKRSGAYSNGGYNTHPYVLLNYHGTLNDVLTVAHEMGHAVHTYLSNKHQPYVYSQYRIFVAEVASTVNEILVTKYLMSRLEDKSDEKAFLLNRYLEDFRGTVFRQTMFAEFEKIAHDLVESGEGVTANELCDVYYKLNQKYFGKTVYVDKEIEVEWARIPHFYTDFYVYKYATGFSAATAIAHAILTEGEPAIARYKEFLSSGGSDYPIELLKKAGVDLSTPKPVSDAMKEFKAALDELKDILD